MQCITFSDLDEARIIAGQFPLTLDTAAPWWAGVLVTVLIVTVAYAARSLTPSGAVAALLVGTIAMSRSWGCGAFLIGWFVLASLLSRLGRGRKSARTSDVIEKGDRRDATQVLANGGVFAVLNGLLVLGRMSGTNVGGLFDLLAIGGAGALVAAGADTWATELGTLGGRRPWSLRTRSRVAIGSSGAVTLIGTVSALVGACVLAAVAATLTVVPRNAIAIIALAGFVGSLMDTVIGAWLQARRWCPTCRLDTEQHTHKCGTATVLGGGIGAFDNDAVNFACTMTGAVLAMLLWTVRQP